MGFARILVCLLFYSSFATISVAQQAFKCTAGKTCRSIVGYKSPNTTSISSIQKLFGVKNRHSLLGANNLPLSTQSNYVIREQTVIKIPIPCICFNGTGASNKMPIYTVQPDDTLYYIANDVFMGLLTYPRIQQVNQIENPNLINVSQELWIPLSCSCEEVDGERVMHYAHLVEEGSTVEEIAEMFGTTNDTLYRLNGIANNSQLYAETAFDVPLKDTTTLSSIKNLRSILGANNFPPSTSPNFTIPTKQHIKIPFTCLCINNTGLSNKQPIYTVQKDDAPLSYSSISFLSCDDVDGVKVVHYGHVMEDGSSLELIAQEYGTSRKTMTALYWLVKFLMSLSKAII
uniref:LysM domain-containing protein n=1 Tax=Salix viminalis TaxID=40686 RepID=A0A6N2L4J0_SALVM